MKSFDDELKANGLFDNFDELMHIGVERKSGRYPWGSGENPNQRSVTFLQTVEDLKKKGLTESQIAEGMGLSSTTQLRALKTRAKAEKRAADQAEATRLKNEEKMSNVAIGRKMGINESSVRALLDEDAQARNDELFQIADVLKDNVDRKGMIDIGEGTENLMGISQTKLNTAVAMLEEDGYHRHRMDVPQQGTGKMTTMKVLAKPEISWGEAVKNRDNIETIDSAFDRQTGEVIKAKAPENLSSKRVKVRYAEEGGTAKDGTIELRRGVDDLSLGNNKYAQVRIAVDGTHYLKGMAIYSDNMPDGVDVIFNTNKSDTGNKLKAMKEMNRDKDGNLDVENPFGATIKPGGQRGKLNIVNEEGDWGKWSKSLSSQMLSKQPLPLIKQQLDLKLKSKLDEFDEINNLTNPIVKKKLLESFADDAESSAVHLKAASLPRQGTHAILPINSLRDTEIYAPKYKNGESVVLVRFPHGGIFEIPELKVNNRNKEALSILKDAKDAVGINSKVAERLSGADFDGDTVLVIPNNNKAVRTRSALKELENFDPKVTYKAYEGMPKMSSETKQAEMGKVSNLITDMTIGGASHAEIARAVKHSMVVIDAEKHNLNYKQSAKDNQITELKKKYQGGANKGASTIVSRASSEQRVDQRKDRPASKGGPYDKKTGERVYEYSGKEYTRVTVNEKTGKVKEEVVKSTTKSTKMAETQDARSLIGPQKDPIEFAYADHANALKALARKTRLEFLKTSDSTYSPAANKAYKAEVTSLDNKLAAARRNKPFERQAQLLAEANVKARRLANPDMDKAELKKIKGIALTNARLAVGAEKVPIVISDKEWTAIQAGAISNTKLSDILKNSDMDHVKSLAMPRDRPVMTDSKVALAKARLKSGNTLAEVAESLGVPTSTLIDAVG